ncbi:Uncharacterized protein Yba3 [Buchnera aphidicola (Cinara piceae)]|uniref:Uncharacterized protein Yba3, partial n=1 Tax=Buchnera aphidicola (Cinara piceae) TaxID=1660043 RepID=A0A803GCY8_9GAMM|nr:hypothetical protein [Buchnera aphidicola]VFP88814.1 Uncharacterized protein Yba3 [Buchnera aphidicola (Cinara piceae)]
MSSVSLIKSNLHVNSKIIKKIDNVRILRNKNLNDVDVTIVNSTPPKYTDFLSPENKYTKKHVIYSDQDITNYSVNRDENTNFIHTQSKKEDCNNSINDSDIFHVAKNSSIQYTIQDIFVKIFNQPHIKWNLLNSSNFSDKTIRQAKKLQESFKKLIHTGTLDKKFLSNINDKIVFLNGKMIPSVEAPDIVDVFQTSITDYQSQQLISTYLHPEILEAAWKNLSIRYPEVKDRTSYNVHYAYEIDNIGPGAYKLAVTKMADLQPSYSNEMDLVNQYGVRAAMIVTKDSNPKMKYSFFVQ